MKAGRYFISTGFKRCNDGFWHLLVAVHRHWRLDFVRPVARPGYRRIYVGFIEVEWSYPGRALEGQP